MKFWKGLCYLSNCFGLLTHVWSCFFYSIYPPSFMQSHLLCEQCSKFVPPAMLCLRRRPALRSTIGSLQIQLATKYLSVRQKIQALHPEVRPPHILFTMHAPLLLDLNAQVPTQLATFLEITLTMIMRTLVLFTMMTSKLIGYVALKLCFSF